MRSFLNICLLTTATAISSAAADPARLAQLIDYVGVDYAVAVENGESLFGGGPGIGNNFDYIIIGGGASGCTIANRLTENRSISVLLIEAGPL